MEPADPTPRRSSFTLGGLLLLTLVACGMAAALAYMARAMGIVNENGIDWANLLSPQMTPKLQFGFILFTLAAPLLLMVLVSVLLSVLNWLQQRK